MNGDNWQHRSKTMRCHTCMYFVPKDESVLGRCRRHAPTLGGWPAVYVDDWCGDHKMDSAHVDRLPKAAEDPERVVAPRAR